MSHSIPPRHRSALRALHQRLSGLDLSWAVTGSLGFALHGMDVAVADIDIQTDVAGARAIQTAFEGFVSQPVELSESKTMRSHFGELQVDGVRIEIMGDVEKRLPSGSWENPVDVEEKLVMLVFEDIAVPVMSLEHEEAAYRLMGRVERADEIRQWLARRST